MSDDIFDMGDLDNPAESDNVVSSASSTPKKSAPRRKPTGKKSGGASGKSTAQATGKSVSQKERVPMHVRQVLNANARNGFVRRVVSDTPERIARFELAGWNVVQDGTSIGDQIAGRAESMGSASAVPVGHGSWGVLMEIPRDIYDEDQTAKQAKIEADEKAFLTDTADEVGQNTGETHGSIKVGS